MKEGKKKGLKEGRMERMKDGKRYKKIRLNRLSLIFLVSGTGQPSKMNIIRNFSNIFPFFIIILQSFLNTTHTQVLSQYAHHPCPVPHRHGLSAAGGCGTGSACAPIGVRRFLSCESLHL